MLCSVCCFGCFVVVALRCFCKRPLSMVCMRLLWHLLFVCGARRPPNVVPVANTLDRCAFTLRRLDRIRFLTYDGT